MYTDLVCRGIHPARLLLKISITLTLLKLSGDLKTLGVTTMRLFTCHRQALDRTRTRLILRYDFSGHQVSRDTCYRRKATLESHMRRFMIKRTRKRHKQRKRHVWRLLMNGIREMGRGGRDWKGATPLLQKFKTLPKYEVQHGCHQSFEQHFL